MSKAYFVTGASGHLGSVLVDELVKRNEKVRVFVPNHHDFPKGVEVYQGDVLNYSSIDRFMNREGIDDVTLIHNAAIITIQSKNDPKVWEVNVDGTKNVMELAKKHHINRIIYVSSVHAIEEKDGVITETTSFDYHKIHGQYAKSKCEASRMVLSMAKEGLPVRIVHPSGIIGPGDVYKKNHSNQTIYAMANGTIPFPTQGGYDFVDVRDVVSGILGCEEKGKDGECYILNGNYVTIAELYQKIKTIQNKKPSNLIVPIKPLQVIAPIVEFVSSKLTKDAPLMTPYSMYTLQTNGLFSHQKAKDTFQYCPRPIEETLRDMIE